MRWTSQASARVEIDCAALDRLDTIGAWLLLRTKRTLEHRGLVVQPINVRPEYRALVHTIDFECRAPPVAPPPRYSFTRRLERIGRGLCHALHQGYELVGFFGLVVFETVATVLQPRRLRVAALFHQMEETGLNALPIVGLLSFLIGVVFAYQGADQLRQFGAEVFTVNLLGVGVLRELGGLMAAIIVAGRSGSAFTAQIGTMKVNEELDAIQISGLNTVEVLVLPRLLGIMLTLPLLTFYSNAMGLLGGGVMCYFDLHITIPAFLHQLRDGGRRLDVLGRPDQGAGVRVHHRAGRLPSRLPGGAQRLQRRPAHDAGCGRIRSSWSSSPTPSSRSPSPGSAYERRHQLGTP